jgi:hypothetical protein
MGRILFSKVHETMEKKSPKSRKRAPRQGSGTIDLSEIPNLTPIQADLNAHDRVALRAKQLLAKQAANYSRHDPIPDPDLDLDPIQAPRGEQGNMVDGKTVFPMVKGPQPREKMRTLHGDPDLSMGPQASIEAVIAAIPAGDQALLNFDNKMTAAYQCIRELSAASERLLTSVKMQDPNSEALALAQELRDVSTSVLEPWLIEMDERLAVLLNNTNEGIAENPQMTSQGGR